MGKLNYIDEKQGYEFISDKGIKYDLLEGYSLHGKCTSDIVFIVIQYDEELNEKVNDILAGYMYGATFVTECSDSIKDIDYIVNRYEKENNL